LDLQFIESTPVKFADGRIELANVYGAQAFWDDSWRNIFVQASEGDVLAGMRLLANSVVTIDVRVGGVITIETRV
jgi:hypothetical protein